MSIATTRFADFLRSIACVDANPFDSSLADASRVSRTYSLDAIRMLKNDAATSARTDEAAQGMKQATRQRGAQQEGTVHGPQARGGGELYTRILLRTAERRRPVLRSPAAATPRQ
jgi:hypothetical protein